MISSMNPVRMLFYMIALVLLILAAIGIPAGRISLLAAGLACWLIAYAFVPMLD
jgi:hypothetical protein